MAGLRKAKKYDWKDSNMALFGSDTEKQVKKESAECEAAWKNAGEEVGIQIWRIVKFKVEKLPKEDYGKFYNGDSYIILSTYKEPGNDELLYNVHFWIGQYSTPDEYGTAAYKTVELDTFLDDKPVQHREVMNYESKLFKSYFDTLQLLKGGSDSGFRRVLPTEYKPRLFRVAKTSRKKIEVKEVPLRSSSIKSEDVFILDNGLDIYQWNGSKCHPEEPFKAAQFIAKLRSERNGKPSVERLDEKETSDKHAFYDIIANGDDDEEDDDDEEEVVDGDAKDMTPELHKVSNESGSMRIEKAKSTYISRHDFKSEDVFILDTKDHAFVWIGKDASIDERRNAMSYAHHYLMKTDHPTVPVTCLSEGTKCKAFESAIAA